MIENNRRRRGACWNQVGLAALLTGLTIAPAAYAQEATARFSIPAQPLSSGLLTLGRQARISIAAPATLVAGKAGNAVQGELSVRAALALMLANSGLRFEFVNASAVRVMAADTDPQSAGAAEASGEASQVSEVVVTGTHIKGAPPAGSELVTVSRGDIQETGRATVTDLLRTLPLVQSIGATEAISGGRGQGQVNNQSMATSVNLRGLGADATLVLVNGRRVAPTAAGVFVDVSQIPLAAVDRLEIVPDGASALYGSDAVGGVVNFILKRHFQGADSSFRYGIGSGFHEYTADQLWGLEWNTGSATLAYEYYSRSHLAASKRAYYQSDLTAFGGTDFRDPRYSNPGNIYSGGILYAIPRNQDGTHLNAADLVPGTSNRLNQQLGADILPSQHRHSVVASINQDLSANIHLYTDVLFSTRSYAKLGTATTNALTVPNTNPFFVSPSPAATSTRVYYSFVDDYRSENVGRSTNYTVTSGVKLDLWRDWTGEFYGTIGQDNASTNFTGAPNFVRLAAALADPNPATAFNPFGDGSHTPAATLAKIAGSIHYRNIYDIRSLDLGVSGALFDLPGGAVRVALGGDYRVERLTTRSLLDFDQAAPYALTSDGATHRSIVAGYAELLAPLFGQANARPGFERLDLSVAVRTEHYSDFGTTTNPKVGLVWKPIGSLTLRGSWGTSFKAPRLAQLNEGQNVWRATPFANASADPASSTTAFPGYSNTLVLLGYGNKDLKPETARSWSVGGDFRPASIPGLTASLTYFSINYRNRISTPTVEEVSAALAGSAVNDLVLARHPTQAQVDAIYGLPIFLGPVLPADQVEALLKIGLSNYGAVEEQGLDAGLGYRFRTGAGSFDLEGDVTYLTKYSVQRLPGDAFVNALNTISNPDSLHGRASINWSRGPYAAGFAVNYTGAYINNLPPPTHQKVSAWTTLDAHFAYEIERADGPLHGVTLTLDVQNLLGSDPPFVNNEDSMVGYDPELGDPRGRVVSIMIRKAW